MLRKSVIVSLVGLFVLTLGVSVAARAESKQEIDVAVSDTLQRFTSANPAHAELLRKAAGVLVFPRITKAGAGIGGEHGDGALLKGGATVHYYSLTSASLGLTLGAGQRSEVLLFMTREALEKFEASHTGRTIAGSSATGLKHESHISGFRDARGCRLPDGNCDIGRRHAVDCDQRGPPVHSRYLQRRRSRQSCIGVLQHRSQRVIRRVGESAEGKRPPSGDHSGRRGGRGDRRRPALWPR